MRSARPGPQVGGAPGSKLLDRQAGGSPKGDQREACAEEVVRFGSGRVGESFGGGGFVAASGGSRGLIRPGPWDLNTGVPSARGELGSRR